MVPKVPICIENGINTRSSLGKCTFFSYFDLIIVSEERLRDESRPFCFELHFVSRICSHYFDAMLISISMLSFSLRSLNSLKDVLRCVAFLHTVFHKFFDYDLCIVALYI